MKIEFTDQINFGEKTISEIEVLPLNYISFAKLWVDTQADSRSSVGSSSNAIMQRKRIVFQTKFMAGNERLKPEPADITQLPIGVAKRIIASLEDGTGEVGSLLNDGDGISQPVHYKLGTPLSLLVNGKKTEIAELEFSAKVYGDIEDVLASDGEVPQVLELLRRCAQPVGLDSSMTALPTWALDRLTVADGIGVIRHVLPRFLE